MRNLTIRSKLNVLAGVVAVSIVVLLVTAFVSLDRQAAHQSEIVHLSAAEASATVPISS